MYVSDGENTKVHGYDTISLALRKLVYAPEKLASQPSAVAVKEFRISSGNVRLEATLDKEVRYRNCCRCLAQLPADNAQ